MIPDAEPTFQAEASSPVVDSRAPAAFLVQMAVFVAAVAALMGGAHYYVGQRVLAPLVPAGWPSLVAWLALWTLAATVPSRFLFGRVLARSRLMNWVAHLWMGVFAQLLVMAAAFDVLVLALRLVGVHVAPWVQALAVVAVVAPMTVLGFVIARGRFLIEKVTVPVRGLGEAFRGLRIVQVSDLHIGETLDARFLARVVEQVNALSPDLVAITGDLVDGSVQSLRDELSSLRELRAKLGAFYVTGNHEYYHGGPAWEAAVRRLGVRVLHNEHQVLERGGQQLVVAGVTDYDAQRFGPAHASRPDLAFAGAPPGVPRLLLAHQPRSARAAAAHDVSLMLSGHTHGGQFFPWMYLVRLQQPVVRGFAVLDGVPTYTSRGTGYWGPPLRLGTRPEISVLTLVPA